jgi:NAD-dependent SIR2 family protein deacetylase
VVIKLEHHKPEANDPHQRHLALMHMEFSGKILIISAQNVDALWPELVKCF